MSSRCILFNPEIVSSNISRLSKRYSQVANMDGSNSVPKKEEEQPSPKSRKRRKTSLVWLEFTELELPYGNKKAECMHCKAKLSVLPGGVTTHFARHLERCPRRKVVPTKQQTVKFEPVFSTPSQSSTSVMQSSAFSSIEFRVDPASGPVPNTTGISTCMDSLCTESSTLSFQNAAPPSVSRTSVCEQKIISPPEKTIEVVHASNAEDRVSLQMYLPVEIKQNNAMQVLNYRSISFSTLSLVVVSRILKGIPQNPHFFQLRNYSELAKKNLMFGWDQTFEETVDHIHALQVVDFWVSAKNLWKTMEDLQGLGYNVFLLRKRLVELTDMMVKQKSCQSQLKRLKNKAEFHRMEKSRLENMILSLRVLVQRENNTMIQVLRDVAEIEKDLPKFDSSFVSLALEPLY